MSKGTKNTFKIGEAAKLLGVSIDTLRRWDISGRLTSNKTPGGTRFYTFSQLRKINPSLPSGESIAPEPEVKTFGPEAATGLPTSPFPIGATSGLNQAAEYFLQSGEEPARVVTLPEGIALTPFSRAKASFGGKLTLMLPLALALVFGLSGMLLLLPTVSNLVPSGKQGGASSGQLGRPLERGTNLTGAVLAEAAGKEYLEINGDTVLNGALTINGAADGFAISGGQTSRTLTVTGADVTLDQNLSKASSPTFAALNLSASKNQINVTTGAGGALTWAPTGGAKTITFPDATGTVALLDASQTLTNKSMSGGSNTFTNIPNSALSNSSITVTAGSNLTGGGAVSLGGSVSLALNSSPSISSLTVSGLTTSGTLTVSGLSTLTTATVSGTLGVGGEASLSAKLILDSPTAQINATQNRNLDLGFMNTGRVELLNTSNYVDQNNNLYINGALVAGSSVQGFWQRNSGVVSPVNITDSLIIGSTATGSSQIQLYGLNALNPVASISGKTSQAALVIDNTVGDLFAASSSGLNRFVITQNGNVGIGSSAPAYKVDVVGTVQITGSGFTGLRMPTGATANYILTTDGAGNASWTNSAGGGSFGAWTLSGSTIYPNLTSYKVLLGSTSVLDSTATLRVLSNSGTIPTASISGATSQAALVVDNSGTGDLFTASSSGLNRFVITQNGNVGIGTSNPTSTLALFQPSASLNNILTASISATTLPYSVFNVDRTGATTITDRNISDLGTGADGNCNVTGTTTIDTGSCVGRANADAVNYRVTTDVATSSATITTSSTPTGIAVGDEILIINLRDPNNAGAGYYSAGDWTNAPLGKYETHYITAISGSTLTLDTRTTYAYPAATHLYSIVVQRIPQYANVTVQNGATLQPSAFSTSTQKGGVIFFRATGNVVVYGGGTITAAGKGYGGGAGSASDQGDSSGGNTYNGAGGTGKRFSAGTAGQGGGGGSGAGTGGAGAIGGAGGGGSPDKSAGGGAGFVAVGTAGTGAGNGTDGSGTSGGAGGSGSVNGGGGGGGGTYGLANLSSLYLGSGGGGAGKNGGNTANGGNGGGLIFFSSASTVVNGTISANGSSGDTNSSASSGGGGGGGSGGSIYIKSSSLAIGTSLVTASGGTGGTGNTYNGGAASNGRIRLDYTTILGSTSPSAGSTNTFPTTTPPSSLLVNRNDDYGNILGLQAGGTNMLTVSSTGDLSLNSYETVGNAATISGSMLTSGNLLGLDSQSLSAGNIINIRAPALTSGSVLLATSSATTANLISLAQAGIASFSGTGIFLDFGRDTQNAALSGFTGNFLKFNNGNTTNYVADSGGRITLDQASYNQTNQIAGQGFTVNTQGQTAVTDSTLTLGSGSDGSCTISSTVTLDGGGAASSGNSCISGRTSAADAVNFSITNVATEGATLVNVATSSATPVGLAVNDEILIITLRDPSNLDSSLYSAGSWSLAHVGQYETHKINAITGKTLTLDAPLVHTYDGVNFTVMLQRVPNYTVVTINNGGTVQPSAFSTSTGTGGVIFFRAKNSVTVNSGGTISAAGKGFAGGSGSGSYQGPTTGGITYNGTAGGTVSFSSNGSSGQGGGGGGGHSTSGGAGTVGGGGGGGGQDYGSGAGGGYGTVGSKGLGDGGNGSDGSGSTGGNGGNSINGNGAGGGGGGTYGLANLSSLYLGSGGGGGAGLGTAGGGGNGGGIIFLATSSLVVSGTISSGGNNGGAGVSGTTSGGGGGAGGSVYAKASNQTLGTSLVTASAGAGGAAGSGGKAGGAGGVGRIRLDYTNASGTTSPAAGYTQPWYLDTPSVLVNRVDQGPVFGAQFNGAPIYTIDTSGSIAATGSGALATLILNQTSTGDLFTASKSGTTKFVINNSGYVGVGLAANADTTLATVDLRSLLGTQPVASISGATSMASLVVDNSGVGDIFTASSSGLNRFVITQNGNVGIGTTVPGATLDVKRTDGSTIAQFRTTSGTSNGVFVGAQDTDYGGYMEGTNSFPTNGGLIIKAKGTSGSGLSLYSDATKPILLMPGRNSVDSSVNLQGAGTTYLIAADSSTDILRWATSTGSTLGVISNAGNVGIGTTTPSSFILQTAGSVGPNADNSYDLGSSSLRWRNLYAYNINTPIGQTGQNGFWQRASGTIAPNSLSDSLLIGLAATASGAITTGSMQIYGVNNLTPVASISAVSAPAAFIVDNRIGDLFTASSSGLNRFVITQNGNVGIGTTNPGAPLEVDGLGLLLLNGSTANELRSAGTSDLNLTGGSSGLGNVKFTGNNRGTQYGMFNTSGYFGVNASPSFRVDVTDATANGRGINITQTATSGTAYGLFSNVTGASTTNVGGYFSASGATNNYGLIVNAGNVGIGTTSPVAILDLVGKQNFTAFSAPGALTAGTPTSGGSCTVGTHSYKVTFTSVGGGETTGGTTSNQIACVLTTGQTVPLSAIPTGPAGTISRKVYRTVAGDTGSYLLLTTIADNTTTTFSDTVADGSLGAAAPGSNTTAVASLGTGGTSRMFLDSNGYMGLGLGTGNAALADLDVRKISGAQAIASISGATAKAALLVDNSGTGDLFAASSSGLNRFVITQNGNVGIGSSNPNGILDVPSGTVYMGLVPSVGNRGKLNVGGGVNIDNNQILTWMDTGGVARLIMWLDNAATNVLHFRNSQNGVGGPIVFEGVGGAERMRIDTAGNLGINTTVPGSLLDVRGVNGTNAVSGITSVASISGKTSFATLVVDNSGLGDLFTASSSGLSRWVITQNGNLLPGDGTANGNNKYDVGSSADKLANLWTVLSHVGDEIFTKSNFRLTEIGTTGLAAQDANSFQVLKLQPSGSNNPIASISGSTGFAALTVDNSGTGDLFTASSSGLSRFVITQNGNVGIGTTNPTSTLYVSGNGTVTGTLTVGTLTINSTTGLLQRNSGVLSPLNITDSLIIGGTATGSSQIQLYGLNAMNPVASISGQTGMAALVVDNKGTGDIFTASSSGLNRFVITQNGNVGIGTTGPGYNLDVTGTGHFSSNVNIVGNVISGPSFLFGGSGTVQAGGELDLTAGSTRNIVAAVSGGGSISLNGGNVSIGSGNLALSAGIITQTGSGNNSFAGNVGIGTTSPVARLDIVGSQNFTAFSAPGALTAGTPTSGGSCTVGTHSYKVTFTSVGGGETTAGTVSNQITCVLTTGQTVPLSVIPTGPAGTISRKIYRTVAGDTGNYLLVTTINDNTTTTYSDTTADGSLGAAAPGSNTTAVASIGTGGTSRMFIDSNGYMGLGLGTGNAALADLDVRKISGAQAVASISGATGKASLIVDNSGTGDLFAASSSGLSRFVITQNGNVGIGSTAPGTKLDVSGGATATTLRVGSTNTSNTIRITANVSNFGDIVYNNGGGATGQFNLNPEGTTVLSALSNGNIGIGSTSPVGLLNVQGAVTGNALTIFNQNGGDQAVFTASVSGTTRFVINNSGYVGINAGANNNSLLADVDIRANSGLQAVASISGKTAKASLIVDNSGTGDLFAASSSGLNRFVITQNGNVGIGSTAPAYGLDVSQRTVAFNSGKSGSLGSFASSTNQLPAARSLACTVEANGFIYEIGGESSYLGDYQSTVYYAAINADGSVNKWLAAGNSLPNATRFHDCVSNNGYIYVIGGRQSSGSFTANVYYAHVNADGSVGTWLTNPNVTPSATRGGKAVVANGYVYVLDGATTSVYYGKFNADGTIGPFVTNAQNQQNTASYISAAVANGYIYETGGFGAGAGVYYAKLNSDGSTGPFIGTTALPAARYGHASVAQNGYLYVIGGADGSNNGQNTVYYAKLNADGTVGTWTTDSTTLPTGLFSTNQYVAVNGYIYFIGGQTTTSGAANQTVYYASTARVSLAGNLDLIGLTGQSLASASGQAGGSIYAGNIYSNSNLEVTGNAQIWNGLGVVGGINSFGQLGVASSLGTVATASISGATSYAGLVVDNSGVGDLFTASSSGLNRFVITQNGNVGIGTSNPASFPVQVAGSVGPNADNSYDLGSSSLRWRNLYAYNVNTPINQTGQAVFWQRSSGQVISPNAITDSLMIGQTGTPSGAITTGSIQLYGINNLNPVASISAVSAPAAFIVDNRVGDLFTASSSGLNRFVITQNGNVGIGTTVPGSVAEISSSLTGTNLFNVISSGSNAFTVADTGITNALPVSNTAAGDVAIAYDINFTNPVSSNIKSAAPIAINSGETFNSSTLTLRTYNAGNVVVDSQALQTLYSATVSGSLTVNQSSLNVTWGGTLAAATISAQTSYAGLVVDNKGTGDLFTASSSGLNRFVITQNGNVGIGSTTPAAKVEVNGGFYLDGSQSGYSGGELTLNGGANTENALSTLAGGSPIMDFDHRGTSNTGYWKWRNGSAAGTERMRLDANGNLGIGTSGPVAALDVRSNLGTVPTASISGKTSFAQLVVDNSGVGDLFTASSSGLNRFVITQNGNVGIGTTTIGAKLSFGTVISTDLIRLWDSGSTGSYGYGIQASELQAFVPTGSHFSFNGGGSLQASGTNEVMRITGGGNVGIGTTAPRTNLDVVVSSTSTSSAFFENTNTASGTFGVTIKLDSTTITGSFFETYLDLNGKRIGQIKATSATGVAYQTQGIADFAEYLPADPTALSRNLLSSATVVCEGSTGVAPCQASQSAKLVGVVSTSPGFLGGTESLANVIVGFVGQVPTKIATSSASILAGDPIGVADGGFGQKLTSRGYMIGRALEGWTANSGRDRILIALNLGYYQGDDLALASKLSVDELQAQVASLSAQFGGSWLASSSGNVDISSFSAQLATISGQLTVLGNTQLASTSIGGNLTVGLTSISDVTGDISNMAGLLSLQNGGAKIDSLGNLKILGALTATKVNIDNSNVSAASAGKVIVPAGQSVITVQTTALTNNSLIFVTPVESPVAVAAKKVGGSSFEINLGASQSQNLTVNWWIVN